MKSEDKEEKNQNENNKSKEKKQSEKKNDLEKLNSLFENNDEPNQSNNQSFQLSFLLKNPPQTEGQSFCSFSQFQNLKENNRQFDNDFLNEENRLESNNSHHLTEKQNSKESNNTNKIENTKGEI